MNNKRTEFEYTVLRFVFMVNTVLHHHYEKRFNKGIETLEKLKLIIRTVNENKCYGDTRTFQDFNFFEKPIKSSEEERDSLKIQIQQFASTRTLQFFQSQWLPFCSMNVDFQSGCLKTKPERVAFLVYVLFMRCSQYYQYSEQTFRLLRQGLLSTNDDLITYQKINLKFGTMRSGDVRFLQQIRKVDTGCPLLKK